MNYIPPTLPLPPEIETKAVLKKLSKAHQALAELKGVTGVIPNHSILVNTLSLQEAKDSSAIENIVTTHDELFISDFMKRQFVTLASKEVHSYAFALRNGFDTVKQTQLLTNSSILTIQETLLENNAGYRKLPGTALKNDHTGETIYMPPQEPQLIENLMANLEQFINDERISDLDPLVKMAIIHHQFESIHPFYDGNGRTGRIINILYLVKMGLLTSPVLYLSRYINQNKSEYYHLLQSVRDTNAWEPFIMYILDGVEQTSRQTTRLVQDIRELMQTHKEKIRTQLPKIYSQELLNNLFSHPYTKIEFVMKELDIHRITATKYLDHLVDIGLLNKQQVKKENYYVNQDLFNLLLNVGTQSLRISDV
jgi:Fic family protein